MTKNPEWIFLKIIHDIWEFEIEEKSVEKSICKIDCLLFESTLLRPPLKASELQFG